MLQIYHSNQLDIHKELISSLINNNPLNHPFEQEIILVQSQGMSQWLQIELAQSLGIIANISFPLPETFIWNMFTRVLADIPQESAFTKRAIAWKLMTILPSLLYKPEFKPLRQYLNEDTGKRKLYQLSARIADLFEQYLVYRPQWLESWRKKQLIEGLSDNQQWQKLLWLELIEYTEKLNQPKWHLANVYQQFIKNLHTNIPSYISLPKRVFVCGISALPPVYLQTLNALGQHIDIHLMFTNPCRYYWGDIQSYASLAKLERRKLKNYRDKNEIKRFKEQSSIYTLFNQQGEQFLTNPLLASWGKLGRDNLYFLSELDQSNEVAAFVDLTRDCLLHQIQQDILDLEDHAQFGLNEKNYNNSFLKRQLRKQDKSLTFHSCHSPLREVEVLQDYLLQLFEENPNLTPKDIIIMVADIDSYTPYIQAVFSHVSPERRLPFSISDRKVRQIHPILQAFISLLDLPKSRFTTEQVLALLEVPALARRFSIDNEELILLRRWIKESGIRWGLDDQTITILKLPVTGQNTWAFGLNRMLLGYAMDSNVGTWNKILPYDECTGLSAQLAGLLAAFIDSLASWRNKLNQERKLAEWLPLCKCLLDTFFEPDEHIEAIFIFILQQWQKTIETGIVVKYEDVVPISLIRDELSTCFDDEKISQRFLAGAINFCTLIPMRSIPFKVVCLLGMNDRIYPRSIPPLWFDLIAEQPQRGDRKRRDDDIYLFLEALNSASKIFYLSYIGHAMRNNQVHNPSVLVNELLDYISQSFCLEGDEHLNIDLSADRVKEHLVTKHTRVPFAKENYLPNSIHQSYASEWLSAARKKGNLQPEFCTLLMPLIEHNNEISLEQLMFFYRHPIRAFFQKRLKVIFLNEEVQLPENEPFIVNNLQQYKFNERLLNALIYKQSLEELLITLRATGGLPAEHFGQIYWEKQIQDLQPLADKIKINYHEYFNKQFVEPFNNVRLSGQLRNIKQNGIIRYRPANLTINDGLSLWIEHLIFCLTIKSGTSYFWGINNSEWCFNPVDKYHAKVYLQQLINGYQEGMNSPLPLLLKSGWNLLMSCYNKKSNQFDFNSEAIWQKAKIQLIQSLQGTYNHPGEMKDSYISRAFSKIDNNLLETIKKKALTYLLPMAIFIKNKRMV
ncbi:RecBCD enzyme subunit RecC [Arsenophonus endosymbiont of Aleurodicus dispersus]|uniref:exodeoxyribonuclease V subunit gamma n=1 Tax=Arsenophonus endosymbiont of Aleurodicus dispersus TaxID=235559 RepID=UPI000EB38944|nr:exodeoxyribonuclease V subunit gamma [Arsenophonus endosymbiont of Aleurodicus dispersus]VAY02177.1 RecBCD enzyme subunit RecC [Arsenophonus endosymbiont of Aleurodicus dispersus]